MTNTGRFVTGFAVVGVHLGVNMALAGGGMGKLPPRRGWRPGAGVATTMPRLRRWGIAHLPLPFGPSVVEWAAKDSRITFCLPLQMNDALRDQIIAEITAAFSGVRRGEITLHEADVIDDCGSDSARRAAHARDTEKRWQDVPDADIESYSGILCFVCPESFRYYIAAYMVWSLRNYRSSKSASSDWTIYALTPNTNKPLDERMLSRFDLFSAEQARAVRRFLEYMAVHGDGYADATVAKLGLEVYWNKRGAAAPNQL